MTLIETTFTIHYEVIAHVCKFWVICFGWMDVNIRKGPIGAWGAVCTVEVSDTIP
jgi:hypothetical protein